MTKADEIKTFLVDWLIKFGVEPQIRGTLVLKGIDYTMLAWCIDYGYMDELQDPFTKTYSHKITEEGLDFIQRRKI